MTDDNITPSYPALTIDTLAFAIAMDWLFDPDNHDEFSTHDYEGTQYEQLVQALYDDMHDLIHNGNEDDWLLTFYDNDGSTGAIEKVAKEMQGILYPAGMGTEEHGLSWEDHGRHTAALNELAEKAASIVLKTRAGIPGRFGFAPGGAD